MFRKLQDRLTAALGTTDNSGSSDTEVERLQQLGFSATQARDALQRSDGNVDRAAAWLLQQSPQHQQQQFSRDTATSEDDDLQRALAASVLDEQKRQSKPRTAAMNKAAEAAANRAAQQKQQQQQRPKKKAAPQSSSTHDAKRKASSPSHHGAFATTTYNSATTSALQTHHPSVSLVPHLHSKSTEEQIVRTADRMKGHPAAVDTLVRALTALQKDPTNPVYRKIDTSSPGYQRSVSPAPGASDFLKAMRYFPDGTYLIQQLEVDAALLFLGISALQQVQGTTEYRTAKTLAVFDADVNALLASSSTSKQTTATGGVIAPEPNQGGALMTIHVGSSRTVRRRFDADDTLQDLLHWLSKSVAPGLVDKLKSSSTDGTATAETNVATPSSSEWCLVDLNRRPRTPLEISRPHQQTLQAMGCWPSGRLQVFPTSVIEAELQQQQPTSSTSSPLPSAPNSGGSHGLGIAVES